MAVLARLPRSRPVLACTIALTVFAGLGLARELGWLEVPELALYDDDLRAAARNEVLTEPLITLVLIGEEDTVVTGIRYPTTPCAT
jgi:hypothetical protein